MFGCPLCHRCLPRQCRIREYLCNLIFAKYSIKVFRVWYSMALACTGINGLAILTISEVKFGAILTKDRGQTISVSWRLCSVFVHLIFSLLINKPAGRLILPCKMAPAGKVVTWGCACSKKTKCWATTLSDYSTRSGSWQVSWQVSWQASWRGFQHNFGKTDYTTDQTGL